MLYNFARARKALRKGGTVIAVEGYMDVIALAQAGFENVVAPLGTALTENQLELLWRMAAEPVLCFDGDQAGLKAAWRAADLALPLIAARPHVALRAAAGGQGPRRSGQGRAAPRPSPPCSPRRGRWPICCGCARRRAACFDTPERRAELEKTLRELTARISDESLRYHYAQEMRERRPGLFRRRRGARRGPRAAGGAGGAERSAASARARGALAVSESCALGAGRSAAAGPCRCAKRRSSWRWSTIRH